MHFDAGVDGRLTVNDGTVDILEYVYRPVEPQIESPRPHASLRTRSGVQVTAHRPVDHVWHKGLSLALPVVGPHNFWGGPTYVHEEGYVQLANNGAQVHLEFQSLDNEDGVARMVESLDWLTESGERLMTERRILTVRTIDEEAWALTWRSELTNVSDEELAFGSPTSKGRENAGYAGLFWRGPESFEGGHIVGAQGEMGDAARGEPARWLAFIEPRGSAGVLILDAADTEPPWFARAEGYAGLNPAPFFFTETLLAPNSSLVLAAALIIGGADVARFAAPIGAHLIDELRRSSSESNLTDREML